MQPRLHIQDFDDDFDPFNAFLTIGGEGDITDVHPELARLRRDSPVQELDLHEHFGAPAQLNVHGFRSFLILGFDECLETFSNHEVFSNGAYKTTVLPTFGESITTMDPPEHLKYRKLFQAGFTPRMLIDLQPRFEAVVDRLLDQFVDKKQANLVEEFVIHFPFQFICDLMDLPLEDRPIFHKLAHAQTCIAFDPHHAKEAARLLGNYLTSLVKERRALKSDSDFVSAIANAELEDGERLPDPVVLGFFRQLMNAGGDTSYHGFSNILAALFTHPEQLDAIREDRSLIPQTIEEGLRWYGPFTAVDRITTRETEMGGKIIPAGAYIRVCIGAANRDETRWPDPDKFDIFREQKRHLSLGHGVHICVGQHLARLELQVALNKLLDRLPGVRLDPDKAPPLIRGLTFRGAGEVNVKWD